MKAIHHHQDWGNRYYQGAMAVLRMLLGLFLLIKGCAFLQNLAYLKWMLLNNDLANLAPGVISFLMFYVIFFHMTGGALIMLGVWTRLAALIQLPIIVAAIFVINNFKSPLNSELWLSVLSGALLLIFLLIGSGPYSLDRYFSKSTKE